MNHDPAQLTVCGETFTREIHPDLGERWMHASGLMFLTPTNGEKSVSGDEKENNWKLWVGDYSEGGADLACVGSLEYLHFDDAKLAVAQLLKEKLDHA